MFLYMFSQLLLSILRAGCIADLEDVGSQIAIRQNEAALHNLDQSGACGKTRQIKHKGDVLQLTSISETAGAASKHLKRVK